jgi:hypothetical protein
VLDARRALADTPFGGSVALSKEGADMVRAKTTGPSYQELRPFKNVGHGFPVYPRLVDDLAGAGASYNRQAVHVCSVLAGWAYSTSETVATMMVRLGLERNRCRSISLANDTMFVCSTAFLIQSECGRLAMLAYRGTEPVNFINWLTDADVNPLTLPVPGGRSADGGEPPRVHGGFYRNQRATWFDVEQGLRLALGGRSILGDDAPVPNKLEALYITGHSLGAAMAALAAFRIAHDDAYVDLRQKLRGVYTFGQPMVGNKSFAAECEKDPLLGARFHRHIYENDVVPVLPPHLAGEFAHFGSEYHSNGKEPGWNASKRGDYVKQLSHFTGPILIAASAFTTNQIPALKRIAEVAQSVPLLERAGLVYSLYDHGTANYIDSSRPDGVISEFGDF